MRLFPQRRSCRCGKSWGYYLDDNATTIQTWPSLSLGLANPDFVAAERAFADDPNAFSPVLTVRCWINPASEPDVTFVDASLDADADADPDAGSEPAREVAAP